MTNETEKIYTWQDLKDFCNNLPEEVMGNKIYALIGDNSQGSKVDEAFTIPEDVYNNIENEEDCGTLSELKTLHGEEFDINNYELSTKKGTPFIWIDTI